MKLIICDTREKKNQHILDYLDSIGIDHGSNKLDFGDYSDWEGRGSVVERKQNIAEIAQNCTRYHDRFRRELERAKASGRHMVILVEQNRYKDRDRWIHVTDISDLMLWSSPHTTIRGEKVFRVLASWVARYDIEVQFCDRRSTGKKIVEIIYGNVKTM